MRLIELLGILKKNRKNLSSKKMLNTLYGYVNQFLLNCVLQNGAELLF